jgi:hypothetical protein
MSVSRSVIVCSAILLAASPAAATEKRSPDPAAAEFFEKKVRPVLAEHCYKCHSTSAKKKRGGLTLDSREALLKGGDTGPAVKPGHPEASLLIKAIGYGDPDLRMPPKSRLSEAELAALTAWVKMGAPWPADQPSKTAGGAYAFDLQKRKEAHWAWQPIRPPQAPPPVKDSAWPCGAIDRFLLAALEAKGLKPAPAADRRTLLRRVSFDLVGLPPSPEEVEAFVKDSAPGAYARVVDRLLASPAFGERWGRHWLDLVRYAESRGHEFDYATPNAYQYRDYVVRALNADVPYDRFVTEHVAGDLLPRPRLHPAEGFNESILGTGFWFLGEEVHSPVDLRQDKADRFDNRIDVLTKTFLGLTVACARCHDHKFDAITQKDYYALAGFLESSGYRLVRFDALEHNRRLAHELAGLRAQARPAVQRALAEAVRPGARRLAEYLLAAREVLLSGAAGRAADLVFEDFEKGTYEGWTVTGTAFGDRPQSLATIAKYQGRINGVGKYFVNSHNVRGGEDVTAGDAHKGTLTSQPFRITHAYITMLVGGGARPGKTCVNLLLDGKPVLSATGRNSNQMFPVRWDVRAYQGKTARIQVVDDMAGGWGNIGVDHIVFTDTRGREAPGLAPPAADRARLAQVARARKLDADLLGRWVQHLLAARRDPGDPLHAWARVAGDPSAGKSARLAELLRPTVEGWRKRAADAAGALKGAEVVVDYARCGPESWLPDDLAFGTGPVRAGDLSLGGVVGQPPVRFFERGAAEFDPVWRGLKPAAGSEGEPGALGKMVRAGRTLRTPTFTVQGGKVFSLVRGKGMAYAAVGAHVLINGPLHGQLVLDLNGGPEFRWVAHDLTAYKGHRTHVEFTAAGADFAVALVVQAEQTPGPLDSPAQLLLALLSGKESGTLEGLAAGYQRQFLRLAKRLEEDAILGRPDAGGQARLADWLVRHPGLFGEPQGKRLAEAVAPFLAKQKELAGQIKNESRLALAMLDGSGVDERVHIRGVAKAPGEPAPRRFLEALAGPEPLLAARGSGRLELAGQLTDPKVNPLLARVMVNRIWHHLFGRGLVASVDNVGELGDRPTHPELLDYLADRFIKEGWSVKKMVRTLVLTRAYRMSSRAGGAGDRVDPENVLLHRMRVRRLEGEAIRDSLLAVSGRLDRKLHGPPVPIHLTPFLQGRGRPESGPLDGDGRRSLYLSVRRNFLSPLLLAFDTPIPFSTVGRRTVSNVPAQALILMNDPLVHQQARVWAERVLVQPGTARERVAGMYLRAFSRPPTAAELGACLEFVQEQARLHSGRQDDPAVWADLAHTLFNVKEFIFVH